MFIHSQVTYFQSKNQRGDLKKRPTKQIQKMFLIILVSQITLIKIFRHQANKEVQSCNVFIRFTL